MVFVVVYALPPSSLGGSRGRCCFLVFFFILLHLGRFSVATCVVVELCVAVALD